jgi:hypothetical protein
VTRDLAALDRDVEAARVVDGIRREVAVRLAARAGQRRRQGRTGWFKTIGLLLTAGLAALLTWSGRRASR